MTSVLADLALFASKTFVLFIFVASLLLLFVALLAKNKGSSSKGRLTIKNLNKKYDEQSELLLEEMLNKKELKKYRKEKKASKKLEESIPKKNIFVLNFHGDIKASAVDAFSTTITAVLNVAKSKDEVVVRLENAGGYVHTHGLASAELMRIRAKNIPLTITIDKIAASGGYLMACVGNKILASPFAIIGSIGVIIQMPNFHRLLKDKHVDFIQLTAGEYKRTVTVFGENTEAGKDKLKQEINEVHDLFKQTIAQNRPKVDIDKVSTGEHWLGLAALQLQLVDEIKTSDAYLNDQKNSANLFEITYETKKPLLGKLLAASSNFREKWFGNAFYR